MKLTTSERGGRLIIYLAGELDHHEAGSAMAEIEKLLESALPRDCVLDFHQVRFMDSSGIALILRVYKRMNALGGRLFVENVPSQPMRVLDAAGIDRMIEITPLQTADPSAATHKGEAKK